MAKRKPRRLVLKTFLTLVVLVFVILAFFHFQSTPHERAALGVNFSHINAQNLQLDWKKVYISTLDELGVKYIRIMAYWSQVEPDESRFNYDDVKWMLDEAAKRNAKLTVVVGKKQPRWPECHVPTWARSSSATTERAGLLRYIERTVNELKNYPALEIWQVENEPIFGFGPECPKISVAELKEEIDLVKKVDPNHPTLTTDSGEFGRWLPTASAGSEYFGSTMYRTVHSPRYGYFTYPLPPEWFRLKSGVLNTYKRPQKLFGVELQAEPWFANASYNTPLDEQRKLMNADKIKENVEYAMGSGFERHYLWGVEWWVWMKEKNNDASMWEAAKEKYIQYKE